jgi:hypothetical protein
VGPEQLIHRVLHILRHQLSDLSHLFEEVFHGPRRLELNKHLGGAVADLGKGMGYFPRSKSRVAGTQGEQATAHLSFYLGVKKIGRQQTKFNNFFA